MQTPAENYELEPDFAVVCSFLWSFRKHLGPEFNDATVETFKEFLESTEGIKHVTKEDLFIQLHIKLLRGIGIRVNSDKWYNAVKRFCKDFPERDDKLINRIGYENLPNTVKIRILKNLCEDQFEFNESFKKKTDEDLTKKGELSNVELGRDKLGRSYWLVQDDGYDIHLYRSWRNSLTGAESWNLVCSNKEELHTLIHTLKSSKHLEEDPLRPMVRSKAEMIKDEREHKLKHCSVKVPRINKSMVEKYLTPEDDDRYGLLAESESEYEMEIDKGVKHPAGAKEPDKQENQENSKVKNNTDRNEGNLSVKFPFFKSPIMKSSIPASKTKISSASKSLKTSSSASKLQYTFSSLPQPFASTSSILKPSTVSKCDAATNTQYRKSILHNNRMSQLSSDSSIRFQPPLAPQQVIPKAKVTDISPVHLESLVENSVPQVLSEGRSDPVDKSNKKGKLGDKSVDFCDTKKSCDDSDETGEVTGESGDKSNVVTTEKILTSTRTKDPLVKVNPSCVGNKSVFLNGPKQRKEDNEMKSENAKNKPETAVLKSSNELTSVKASSIEIDKDVTDHGKTQVDDIVDSSKSITLPSHHLDEPEHSEVVKNEAVEQKHSSELIGNKSSSIEKQTNEFDKSETVSDKSGSLTLERKCETKDTEMKTIENLSGALPYHKNFTAPVTKSKITLDNGEVETESDNDSEAKCDSVSKEIERNPSRSEGVKEGLILPDVSETDLNVELNDVEEVNSANEKANITHKTNTKEIQRESLFNDVLEKQKKEINETIAAGSFPFEEAILELKRLEGFKIDEKGQENSHLKMVDAREKTVETANLKIDYDLAKDVEVNNSGDKVKLESSDVTENAANAVNIVSSYKQANIEKSGDWAKTTSETCKRVSLGNSCDASSNIGNSTASTNKGNLDGIVNKTSPDEVVHVQESNDKLKGDIEESNEVPEKEEKDILVNSNENQTENGRELGNENGKELGNENGRELGNIKSVFDEALEDIQTALKEKVKCEIETKSANETKLVIRKMQLEETNKLTKSENKRKEEFEKPDDLKDSIRNAFCLKPEVKKTPDTKKKPKVTQELLVDGEMIQIEQNDSESDEEEYDSGSDEEEYESGSDEKKKGDNSEVFNLTTSVEHKDVKTSVIGTQTNLSKSSLHLGKHSQVIKINDDSKEIARQALASSYQKRIVKCDVKEKKMPSCFRLESAKTSPAYNKPRILGSSFQNVRLPQPIGNIETGQQFLYNPQVSTTSGVAPSSSSASTSPILQQARRLLTGALPTNTTVTVLAPASSSSSSLKGIVSTTPAVPVPTPAIVYSPVSLTSAPTVSVQTPSLSLSSTLSVSTAAGAPQFGFIRSSTGLPIIAPIQKVMTAPGVHAIPPPAAHQNSPLLLVPLANQQMLRTTLNQQTRGMSVNQQMLGSTVNQQMQGTMAIQQILNQLKLDIVNRQSKGKADENQKSGSLDSSPQVPMTNFHQVKVAPKPKTTSTATITSSLGNIPSIVPSTKAAVVEVHSESPAVNSERRKIVPKIDINKTNTGAMNILALLGKKHSASSTSMINDKKMLKERSVVDVIKNYLSNMSNVEKKPESVSKVSNAVKEKVAEKINQQSKITMIQTAEGWLSKKEKGDGFQYPEGGIFVIAGPQQQFYEKKSGFMVELPPEIRKNLVHKQGAVYYIKSPLLSASLLEAKKRARKKKSNLGVDSAKTKRKSEYGPKRKRGRPKKTPKEDAYLSVSSDTDSVECDDRNSEEDEEEEDLFKTNTCYAYSSGKKTQFEFTDNGDTDGLVQLNLGRNARLAQKRNCLIYIDPWESEAGREDETSDVDKDNRAMDETGTDDGDDDDDEGRSSISRLSDLTSEDSEAACCVCGSGKQPHKILLCDNCDAQYHLYCISPPLSIIPLEDWYCNQCQHLQLIKALEAKYRKLKKRRSHGGHFVEADCLSRNKQEKALAETEGSDLKPDENASKYEISEEAFGITPENIIPTHGRACTKKTINYNEREFDRDFADVMKKNKYLDHSDKKGKRASSSEKSHPAKKRKTTPVSSSDDDDDKVDDDNVGADDDTDKNDMNNKQSVMLDEDTEESSNAPPSPLPTYFTSSGRRTKNISYTE